MRTIVPSPLAQFGAPSDRVCCCSFLTNLNRTGEAQAEFYNANRPPSFSAQRSGVHGVHTVTDMEGAIPNGGRARPKPVRCPYCVEGGQFRIMTPADADGWFLCMNCGHLAAPDSPGFECRCTKCHSFGSKTVVKPC